MALSPTLNVVDDALSRVYSRAGDVILKHRLSLFKGGEHYLKEKQ